MLSQCFPSLGVTVPLTSLQLCAGLWPCCGGSSESNLVLLRVPASSVHRHQNQRVFPYGSAQWPVICPTDTASAWLTLWFNLQLVEPVGRLWVFFLSHAAPGFQLWFYSHLCVWVVHWGSLLRLPCRTWVCPVRPGAEVVPLLGSQGFWQHQVLRGVGG